MFHGRGWRLLRRAACSSLCTRLRNLLSAFLHQSAHGAEAQEHLSNFIEDLIGNAVKTGKQPAGEGIRSDVAPRELALFSLHAVNAAVSLPTADAARTLTGVIIDGLTSPA